MVFYFNEVSLQMKMSLEWTRVSYAHGGRRQEKFYRQAPSPWRRWQQRTSAEEHAWNWKLNLLPHLRYVNHYDIFKSQIKTVYFLQDIDKGVCAEEEMEICRDDAADWEELSMDSVQWNLLLRQLEDLSMLDFVLQQRIKVSLNALPYSLRWKSMPISLRLLLEKGRGEI